jgi:hypothetical protein
MTNNTACAGLLVMIILSISDYDIKDKPKNVACYLLARVFSKSSNLWRAFDLFRLIILVLALIFVTYDQTEVA